MASTFRPTVSQLLATSTRPSASSLSRTSRITPQCRIAAFHTSQRQQILPMGPRKYILYTPYSPRISCVPPANHSTEVLQGGGKRCLGLTSIHSVLNLSSNSQ